MNFIKNILSLVISTIVAFLLVVVVGGALILATFIAGVLTLLTLNKASQTVADGIMLFVQKTIDVFLK